MINASAIFSSAGFTVEAAGNLSSSVSRISCAKRILLKTSTFPRGFRTVSATVQAVQEFDLVLAHLHVPEMA